MNFTADRTNLLAAAEAAARNIDPKAPNDLLKTTLVRAVANGIEIYASDMTFALQQRVPAMVIEPGEICLPATELRDALSALPKGEVNFEMRSVEVKTPEMPADTKAPSAPAVTMLRAFLKAGRRTVQLPTRSAEGYPPFAASPTWIEIPAASLLSLFRFSQHASSSDMTRPHLCGVKLDRVPGKITATTTDGHRMATTEVPFSGDHPINVLVPTKAVAEILRVITAHPEAVTVEFAHDDSTAFARIGDTTMLARLAQGRFPTLAGMVPVTRKRSVRVARGAVIEVLRAMSKVNKNSTANVKLDCSAASIRVSTDDDDQSGNDCIDCEMEGSPFAVGFNGGYLADALDAFSGSEVLLEFGDELDPGVVRSAEGGPGLAVIMPSRIR